MSPAPRRRPRRALAAAQMYLSSAQALEITTTALGTLSPPPDEDDPTLGPRVTPLELRAFLARLRLLDGVPFSYLVADSELLPTESIRFFYLDRAWTDALVQGALSVGTVSTADRAQLEALYGTVRDEVDEEERLVRLPGGEAVQQGPAGPVTGFLLRSRAVSGWPGLHVRAYREELGQADDATIPESDPRRLKLLRMERLAPAVLLVLFDGVPAVVQIEEPRQGIQFGVQLLPAGGPNDFTAEVVARDAQHRGRRRPQDARRRALPAGRARRARSAPPQRQAHAHQRDQHGDRGRRRRVRTADAALPLPPGVRRPVAGRHAADRRRLPPDQERRPAEDRLPGGARMSPFEPRP